MKRLRRSRAEAPIGLYVTPRSASGISNFARYRVRSLPAAGALVREEDSEEQQMTLI